MQRRTSTLHLLSRIGGKELTDAILDCEAIIRSYDRKYGEKPAPGLWATPGAVLRTAPAEQGMRFECERGWTEIVWVSTDVVRVRFRAGGGNFEPPISAAVSKHDWSPTAVEIDEFDDSYELRSSTFVCRVFKQPFRVQLETHEARIVCGDSTGIQYRNAGVRLSMRLHLNESCYGMGERTIGLNFRGKRLRLWNAEAARPSLHEVDPLPYSVPFYLGVHDDGIYGVFWDNAYRGTADLGASSPGEWSFEAEGGELCYYLFPGRDVNEVVARLTELTGGIELPPLWALGYHQSRVSYTSQQQVLEIATEFRRREIPCDALYLDLHAMHTLRPFTWDYDQFPNVQEMVEELHKLGFKVVLSLYPGLKTDDSFVYRRGLAQDAYLKYPDGEVFRGAMWAGICNVVDFAKPAARAWWVQECAALLSKGIDGLSNDVGEPSIFRAGGAASAPPDYVRHEDGGIGASHLAYHNLYGAGMASASHDALVAERPELRQFNLTRAGYAGTQRFAVARVLDSVSDWEHLRLSLSAVLSMALSGIPLAGADVGGTIGDANPELLTRWLQAGCLLPFFRNHSLFDTVPQEPWAFGQPYELINRLTIQLRYRLMPYLYSVVAQCHEFGWPLVRPLFAAEPRNLSIRNLSDAFLLGKSLLVAPVLEAGAIERDVYLPPGTWYDYWTLERWEGGKVIRVPAPLERLPLFVRAGTVMPTWSDMQYVSERSIDSLRLRVFPGVSESVLYEDAGEGLDYRQGDYRWVYTTCVWEDELLTLRRRVAGKYQPSYKTIRVEFVNLPSEPVEVKIDRYGAPIWYYDSGILEVAADDRFSQIQIGFV